MWLRCSHARMPMSGNRAVVQRSHSHMSTSDNQTVCGSGVHMHVCQCLATDLFPDRSHSHMLASYNQRVWLRHSQQVCKWLTTKRVLFDWAWCNQAHAHGCSHAHGTCVQMHTCPGACKMCENLVQLHTGHDVFTHMCVGCMQYG